MHFFFFLSKAYCNILKFETFIRSTNIQKINGTNRIDLKTQYLEISIKIAHLNIIFKVEKLLKGFHIDFGKVDENKLFHKHKYFCYKQ